MSKTKVTLDKFYAEFVKFVQGNEKRWVENEKRWLLQDKKWVSQEKRWSDNKKQLNRIEKRSDDLFNTLDIDVMKNRKRIKSLERKVFAN